MRITHALIAQRIEYYEKEYGFTSRDGWHQVVRDLKPPKTGDATLPRAVAYGAYMELLTLLEM